MFSKASILVVGSLLSVLSGSTYAQEKPKSQADLIELRDQKLGSEFLGKSPWTTDFKIAKNTAKKQAKLILAYFTRSFAPSPASQDLEDRLFTTKEFGVLARPVVLFCHVTSKVVGDPDQGLMRQFGGQGFPFVMALDERGLPIAHFQESLSLEGFEKFLQGEVAGYASLRTKAKSGDKNAQAEFLIRRIRLGHLQPGQIQMALDIADYLSAAQRKVIEQGLAGLEIREILARIDDKDPASFNRAAERFVAMKKSGRVPSGSQAPVFWQVILAYADTTEDPALFEEALQAIAKLPGKKEPEQWMRRMQLRLRALQFMKGKRGK
jgi:hypothetical protein